MQFLPDAFKALSAVSQFIVCKFIPRKGAPGKMDKVPVDYKTGHWPMGFDDPAILTDADTAILKAKELGTSYGVGFSFFESDQFWFLDIDDCLNSDGTWSPLAVNLISLFNGAAVEVSFSKKGLHIIGVGKSPSHSCKNTVFDGTRDIKIEFYTEKHFVALTGYNAYGDAGKDFTSVLPGFVEAYGFNKAAAEIGIWTDSPCEQWNGPVDDSTLINRALKSQSASSAFGSRASFADLWDANQDVLIQHYLADGGQGVYDESSADAALAQHLAFWTGNDCERIKRLMMQSKLVRDKWNREDYLRRTILKACAFQAERQEWLSDKLPEPLAITASSDPQQAIQPSLKTGTTFLTIEHQIQLFRGCSYICDAHKVLIPGGYLLKPEQFRAMYGGYSFVMDNQNEKTSRNAWEAFTESQGFTAPRAHTSCFRPDQAPGILLEENGQILANLWWPVQTPQVKGDISPFLMHLSKTVPDLQDQIILLSYMAAIVQYKGIKFQWCPLIQGVEGNGKTLFTRCVAYAVGDKYTHFPKAAEIASKFNDWMYCKIFIGVEDIYTADSQQEIIEALKPMITSDRLEIEPKGGAKITRGICCNFLINTNHKDGLRKTTNDRRFAPFYTAQQTLSDLARDGLTGDYFAKLYTWLRNGGFAIVSEFLHTYPIPDEFNPATKCQRAPITSSTEAAVAQGLGSLEQEIQEAIEQGKPGFRAGWISSIQLDRMLDELNLRRRISHNRRKEILHSLGYEWHPGLKDGRVNNIVSCDGGKPRLYIRKGHIHWNLNNAAEIGRAYEHAQLTD